MYDKCYFCLDQLPKLKKESTASFFVNFGGAGGQKSRPTLLYMYENEKSGSLMRFLTQLQLPNPLHQGLQVTHAFYQDSLQNSQVQQMSCCTHPKVSEQKPWF